jgi:uncharacterized membrane protein YhaH (DUF805 family)
MQAEAKRRSSLALAFKPLRDMFVFSGRSRRTEVVAFTVLGMLANALTVHWNDGAGVFEAMQVGWALLWTFPWLALFVRRLHDQGRSARWAWMLWAAFAVLMAVVPLLPQSANSSYSVHVFHWTFHPVGPLAIIHGIVEAVVGFILLVFFLAPEESGTNRYGPDPRLDPDNTSLVTE